MAATLPKALVLASCLCLLAACGTGEREVGLCAELRWCAPDAPCYDAACPDPDARCRRGREARLYGRATARDGTCVATEDALCAAAEITCAVWGQCWARPAELAPATEACPAEPSDRDWAASGSAACAGRGTCLALRDEDCRRARVCEESGRCGARGGICVAVAEAECAASAGCRVEGACSVDARAGRCVATAPAQCEASQRCEAFGDCGWKGGRCVPCDGSQQCAAEGLCAVSSDLAVGRCLAKSDDGCRRALVCRQEGRCKAAGGRCVR